MTDLMALDETRPIIVGIEGCVRQCVALGQSQDFKVGRDRGLWLRISSRGVCAWSLVYRTKGSDDVQRYGLGRYPDVSVADARSRARELMAGVDNGIDPRQRHRPAAPVGAKRGRPHKVSPTAEELLTQTVVLSLTDFCLIMRMDRSTALRKEREGQIPKRRTLAGRQVFMTAEVRAWMEGAPTGGADPERSVRTRKAREIALARSATR